MTDYKNISGKWRILDNETENEFEGQLTINNPNGIIYLEMQHVDPFYKDEFAFIHTPKHVKCINGILINGAKISLMDCSVYDKKQFKNKSMIAFIAKYALNGVNLNRYEEAVFTSMRYQISQINNWADINSLESYFHEEYKQSIGYKEEGKITLLNNSDMKIILEPKFYKHHERYEGKITLSKSVWVCLEYKTPKNFNHSIKDIQKVLSLVSLGTGTNSTILEVQGFNKDLYCLELNGEKLEYPLEILTQVTSDIDHEQKHPFYWLFSLKDLINENYNLLNNWFSKYEKFEPIIELYLDLYRFGMPYSRAFLNLTQALETYHTRFKVKTKNEYIKRIHKILEPCPPVIKEEHLNYLLDEEQKKRGNVLLRSRLFDLFLAEFQFMFLSGYKTQYEFVIKTVLTRNYFTHYDELKKERIFTEAELPKVVKTLIIVLEYYLLLELGLPEALIKKKILEREPREQF